FLDRIALTAPEIEGRRWTSGGKRVQRHDVRTREIRDVNVVADAGAIGRRVIVAEHGNARVLRRGFENEWNQMRFGQMPFAAPLRGASGVEVSQRDESKVVRLRVPVQRTLDGK